MITLQYLHDVGIFVLDILAKLKEHKEIPLVDLVFEPVEISRYAYEDNMTFGFLPSTSTLEEHYIITALKDKLSYITEEKIIYCTDLYSYTNCIIEEDFFSLSTALTDIQFLELHICKVLQQALSPKERMVINVKSINDYYNNIKDHWIFEESV